jgi:hypothetical protein
MTINVRKLKEIADATAGSPGYAFVSADDGQELVSAGYIVTNPDMANDQGERAAKITDAGKAFLDSQSTAPASSSSASANFTVMSGFVPPASRRRGAVRGAGAPDKYRFKQLEVRDYFFVPATAERPDPFKSLQSTVSSANRRFSESTGETKVIKHVKRGPDHKAILDANGNKVIEQKTVPVMKPTRKFKIVSVKKGVEVSGFTPDADGAVIYRAE